MACTKKKMAKGGMVAKKRQPGPVAPPPGYAIGGIVQERIDSGIGPNWTNTRGYARGGPVGVVGPYDRARAEDVGAIQGLVNLTPSLMNDPQTRQSLLDEKKAEAKQLASDMSSPMYRSGANLSQSQKQAAADEQAGWAARGAAIQSGVEAVGEAPAERSRRTSSKSGAPADLPGPSWAPSGAGPWQDVRDRSATDLSEPGSALSTLNQGGLSLGSLSSGIGQDQSPLGQYQRGGAAMDYRQGGPVAGGPPGVDTVPAMLNNGEYVLPRPTTQAMGGKPALDQAVLATTGKPPVGYAQGGMPVRSTYDQLRLRGQDLNAAVDRMTSPPAAPQGFSVPQQSSQARMRPAPRQSEGRLGGGMPGMERQYADGGQVSGWNVDRAAQIENAVNGAIGQPAPVAPPPAAPEMQLSEGEQYALDSARAAEAAAKPPESKFQTLLRAMTGKPSGYAMGGEVQGYAAGGMPPVEDRYNIRGWAEQARMLKEQEQGMPGTPQPRPVGMGLGAAADLLAARDYRNRNLTGPEFLGGHGPAAPQTVQPSAPTMTPQEQEIMALKPPAPPTQDIPVSRPITNEGRGAPVSKALGPIDMRQANANFRQNVAAIPEGGTMRQYGNTKIYMTRDPKTGQPIFSNISAEAATPAGFETIKAQGKLGGSPFGDPETNRKLTADIRDQRNELRFSRGEPPVGGWPTWGAEQQQRKAEREAGIEAGKDATKIGLTGRARMIVDQANAETAAKTDWGKNATAGLDKMFSDQGMDGVNTRLEAAYQTAADPALQQRFKTPQQQQAFAIGVAGRMPTWTEALELADQDPVAARNLIAKRRQEIVTQMLTEATSTR